MPVQRHQELWLIETRRLLCRLLGWHLMTEFNGGFGDMGCNVVESPLHMRGNAA
jgi:hypothetical protein